MGPKDFQEDVRNMDIDATTSVGHGIGAGRTPGVRGTEAGQFARVFELAEVRRRRMTGPDRIPEEVWDDMHRANQLCDDLRARGQQVRFDTHHLTGRVVASLCDTDGRPLRPLELSEVLGHEPDPAPAA